MQDFHVACAFFHLQVLKSLIEETRNDGERKFIAATTIKLWYKVGGTCNIEFSL